MQVNEFDFVRLRDGRVGTVCDVVKAGAAYFVDFPKPMDDDLGREHGLVTFDTELVEHGDVVAAGETPGSIASL